MGQRIRYLQFRIASAMVCGLSLLTAGFGSLRGQTLGSELTSAELWQPGNVPFSFKYNGKESAQFLSGWRNSEATPPMAGGQVQNYTYSDPVTHLTVTAEVRLYPELPGVVDWVLRFRNDGSSDTPIIEDILPLDWTIPASSRLSYIRHAKGSDGRADDFAPLEEELEYGGFDWRMRDHLESFDGLSSSRNTLPFFNLQTGDHGLIGAIGWSGDWKADFAYTKDGKSITMSSGMKRTHLLLHPGEEIRTPRIVLMSWAGGNWMDSQNRWRRLLLAHYSPQQNGKAMLGPVLFGSWGSELIVDKMAYIQWVHDQGMPFDVYAVDAGWYGGSIGAEFDPTNPKWSPWYNSRGDWLPSPFYYPHGLKPLGEELKADGYGFSLWVEPETAMPNGQIVKQHPDWFLHRSIEPGVIPFPWQGFSAVMANLGDAEARAGITDMISRLITDADVTWYRQDFNIPPAPYWEQADQPNRIGMTEIGYITGLYEMWDNLLAQHPGLRIDNCASGGRRLDIEMMSRSFSIWRTDHGAADTLAVQAQTTGLAPWVPLTSADESNSLSRPWMHPGPYTTPDSLYLVRLAYSAGFAASPGRSGPDQTAWVSWVKQVIHEYREVQPYVYGDFFQQVPYTLGRESWTGWQWDRPADKDGLIILLRRPESPFPTINLNVQHLDLSATYEVELRRGLERARVKKMKGSDLAHMKVQLAQAPSSVLIFYRRK